MRDNEWFEGIDNRCNVVLSMKPARPSEGVLQMSINADWEKFSGGPNRPKDKQLHVTVSNHHRIQFNAYTYQQLGSPEAVYLYFNRREQKIAIQAASLRFDDAFPVTPRTSRSTRVILAAPFFTNYGIKITATHKFIRPEIDADGRLVLNLNETIKVSRVREKK